MPTATYWRLSFVNNTRNVLAVAEIEFYDGAGTAIATTGGTASTNDSTYGAAANAFDGNGSTYWATGAAASTAAPLWVQYQFPSAVTPATYSITNRADNNWENPDSWSLQYSNDGATWTTAGNYSAAWTSAGQTQTFNVSGNGLGTAYRILITANAGGAVVALSEMSFKDGSGLAISLANGASSASSIYASDPNDGSADAFDGNTATIWAAGSASSSGSPEWLAYRFSGSVTPASFTITARDDLNYNQSPTTFKLQKSTDGVTWTDVQSFTAASWTSAGQAQTFTITAATPHQRGNIDYDQIRSAARQGLGSQFQMFGGGSVTSGHLAVYDSNGNVIDGGAPSSSGAVSSVFGRTGAVVAASGDYTAAQITNAVDQTQTYANPSWITSLAYSKITGAPAAYVLPAATATVLGGVKIGANITVLADGTISVAAPPTIPVSSVFGRTGAVVATGGDYTAAQVTNAVDSTQTYANPAWITSLAWSKITGAPTIYVDPLTTTGDVLYRASTGTTRLGIGSSGQVLTVVSGVPAWATPATAPVSSVFGRTGAVVAASGDYSAYYVSLTGSYASPSWLTQINWSIVTGAPAFLVSPLTTKGDILVFSTTNTRLPVGTNNFALLANSAQTTGLAWTAIPISVFGRTGAVVSASGDYTAAQVTNAVDSTQTYSNPAWITALAWSKITGAPTIYTDPLTTTGDVLYRSSSATTRLGIGTAGQVLTVVSGLPAWSTPATAPVTSVFTRTGAITAAAGDYSAFYPSLTGSYSDPAWITGLSWSKIIGAPTIYVDPLTTAGDILYRSSSATTRLPIGTSGQVLTVVSGVPAWAAPTGGGYWVAGSPSGAIYYSGGNVGVNVSSPNMPLHVRSNGYNEGFLLDNPDNDFSTTGSYFRIVMGNSVGNTYVALGQFNSGGSARGALILNLNGGNVGIGKTPSFLLDVAGDVNSSGCYRINGNSFACSDGASGVNLSNITTINGVTPGGGGFWVGGSGGAIYYSGGNVGIGTTSPACALDSNGMIRCIGLGTAPSTGSGVEQYWDGSEGVIDCYNRATAAYLPLFVEGSKLILNAHGGNVGIGTTSPAATFDCNGCIRSSGATAPSSGSGVEIWWDGTHARILGYNRSSPAYLPLYLDGSALLLNTQSAGNVGIGTTSPATLCHLYRNQAATTWLTIDNDNGSAGVGAGVAFNYGSTGQIGGIYHNYTGSIWQMGLQVWNNASMAQVMTLLGNGNVGIGDPNPSVALSVYRSGAVPVIQVTGDWNATSMNAQVRCYSYSGTSANLGGVFRGVGARGTQASPTATQAGDTLFTLLGDGYTNTITAQGQAEIRMVAGSNWTSSNAETYLSFWTTGPGTNTPGERMRIMGSGNIGILVTAPAYLLHLATDSAGKPTTSTWTVTSDARAKRNVRELSGGLDVINRLRATEAEYNGLGQTPAGSRVVGFIAQEVEAVLPHCVTRDDTGILGLNIHEILIHLILAVQQLSKKGN